jgi:hypothetical protein
MHLKKGRICLFRIYKKKMRIVEMIVIGIEIDLGGAWLGMGMPVERAGERRKGVDILLMRERISGYGIYIRVANRWCKRGVGLVRPTPVLLGKKGLVEPSMGHIA